MSPSARKADGGEASAAMTLATRAYASDVCNPRGTHLSEHHSVTPNTLGSWQQQQRVGGRREESWEITTMLLLPKSHYQLSVLIQLLLTSQADTLQQYIDHIWFCSSCNKRATSVYYWSSVSSHWNVNFPTWAHCTSMLPEDPRAVLGSNQHADLYRKNELKCKEVVIEQQMLHFQLRENPMTIFNTRPIKSPFVWEEPKEKGRSP